MAQASRLWGTQASCLRLNCGGRSSATPKVKARGSSPLQTFARSLQWYAKATWRKAEVAAMLIRNQQSKITMPSFDIVSEVDKQEIDNALNQARKELATRFDFKGSAAEIIPEKDKITLTAEDANRLRGLREIVVGKLAKRSVDLRNIEHAEPDISPLGHARQELKIRQGLEGEKAKEIIKAIKEAGFKVQSTLQDRQIRITGKKKDELQSVIQFVRGKDFKVATSFKNFRD